MTGPALTRVGALGSPHQAVVDPRGFVGPDGAGWQLDWWIGADDRWHVPGRDAPPRQRLLDATPVVETVMRVPGGDAMHRAYGVGGPAGILAIEIENASPAPFVVAFVLRPADPGGALQSLAANGAWVSVDGRPVLRTVQRARRWAIAPDGGVLFDIVASGAAPDGEFPTTRDKSGRLSAAFLHPLAHRAKLRALVALAPDPSAPASASDPLLLPAPTQAVLGWKVQLDRGLQVQLPDDRVQTAIEAARASLLLGAFARARPTPAKLIALEDWGFDREAAMVWKGLSLRDRRRAAQRGQLPGSWPVIRDRLATASATMTWPDGPAPLLQAVRELVVHEHDDSTVALLTELPYEWAGQPIEVHDAPTRRGRVSYAVRWHGDRPALLWDCPGAFGVTCPALDPAWSSAEPRGEALLAAPVRPRS